MSPNELDEQPNPAHLRSIARDETAAVDESRSRNALSLVRPFDGWRRATLLREMLLAGELGRLVRRRLFG